MKSSFDAFPLAEFAVAFCYSYAFIAILTVVLKLCNRHLSAWACHIMGWHLTLEKEEKEGSETKWVCPRCKTKFIQYPGGKWVETY